MLGPCVGLGLLVWACAGQELGMTRSPLPGAAPPPKLAMLSPLPPSPSPSPAPAPEPSSLPAAPAAPGDGAPAVDSGAAGAPADQHCAGIPPLLPDGGVPPAPPHAPLGQNIDVPNDRPVYVLPGDPADARVIIYLHGMCGDVTAADYFRKTVRAHGTLLALRGDTPCENGRYKWRADPDQIQARIEQTLKRVNAVQGTALVLKDALLFGYSQGADRAEKLAARYPGRYPRVVLGGPPMKASPKKLGQAVRVAILGGELETTENMRAGAEALQAAGVACRFFTLDCAYHGYFGTNAEAQLSEVLGWVSEP